MAGEEKVRRYRAFIAYSHHDERWAAWLHRRLEFYRVPRRLIGRKTSAGVIQRRLTPIFRDREELATANDLSEKITQALEDSDNLIVVCSPFASRSKWVNEEIRRFRSMDRGSRIFCFVVGGQPPGASDASDGREGLFPATLCGQGAEDRGTGTEPLAADVRPGQDGRGLALMKLIAGLLGVNLDELRRRDLQRRNRRWAAITMLALVVMAATSMLALEATVQRSIAEHQRAQAESLVAFMLGNLRKELQPIGHLDLLDMVGKRVLAYYSSQNLDSLDASSLERRAQALQLIGKVYDQRGDLDEALAAYRQAEVTTARLLASKPDDVGRIYAHAQSVYYVATIAFERGDMTRAEDGFRHYYELAQRLVRTNPNNAQWQVQVENATTNLGILFDQEKDFKAASEVLRKSVAIASALARKFSGDIVKQTDMANTRAWYADAQRSLGHFKEAHRQRMKQLATYQRLLKSNPHNNDLLYLLATCERALALLAIDRGDLNDAVARLDAAIAVTSSLVKLDPTNTGWQEINAGVWITLGEVRYARNEFPAAKQAVENAERIVQALVEKDATVLAWQAGLNARVQLLLARLAAHERRHEAALRIVTGVAATLAAMPADKRNTGSVEMLLVSARLLQGDELQALHRVGDVEAWKRVIDIASTNQDYHTPETHTVMAEAYLRLGDVKEVRRIVSELNAIGYCAPEFLVLKERMARRHTERVSARSHQ